jgi:phosphatidylglycerophosphate synthase
MFDARLAAWIKPCIDGMARALASRGLRADTLTWMGFAIGIGSAALISKQHYLPALAALLLSRLFDALDGAVARLTCVTDRGGFLDITLDFIFYASIPLAFAFAAPSGNARADALAGATLLFTFMATASSFLAYSAIAAKQPRRPEQAVPNQKSIAFLGGLNEAFETYLCFSLMCLLPNYFAVIAYVFAFMCTITAITRIYTGWRDFR